MTRLQLLPALAAALTMTIAAPAGAAIVLGQTVTPTAPSACVGSPDFEIVQDTRGGVSSAAPAAGVITSWSFQAGPVATNVELRTYHHNTVGNTWQPMSPAGPLQLVAANSGLRTYPARVPIAAGDFVGLHTAGGGCYATSGPGDKLRYHYDMAPLPVGTATGFSFDTAIVDLAATVEPDADHDGYGDETQDQCPQLGGVIVPCVPDTAIIKKPKRHATGPKSKLTFTSTIPGSAFSCTLDKRRPRSCASPEKYRCLGPGKHTYSVVAVSPYGLVDPTPAKVRFKVPANRHGC